MREDVSDTMFDAIIARDNLYAAAHRAALGKRFHQDIALWRYGLEENVHLLRQELKTQAYKHSGYQRVTIYEPKKREIAVAGFKDRIVQQALYAVLEPAFDRSFIFDSYACRKGKGVHACLDRAQRFIRTNKHILHGDVKKYYPSVNHAVLKGLLFKRIPDAATRWLVHEIMDSANSISSEQGVGLPIGNLTSQLWANVYLHELDRFVKHRLRARYYLRYMDDFIIGHDDPAYLHAVRAQVGEFLQEKLQLCLNEGKSRVHSCYSGVTFLGFRIYPYHRRLSRLGIRRLRKRLRFQLGQIEAGQMGLKELWLSWKCWRAHSNHGNCRGLQQQTAVYLLKGLANYNP